MNKILIVDDNDQNLYLLKSILKGSGFDVISAVNGAEAFNTAKTDLPCLVISDILMPVMDGFELCRRWKADDELKKIPFIFYTATYTDTQDEEFALSLGADRFVVKPQHPDVLMRIVKEVLEEHEINPESVRIPIEEDSQIVMQEYSEVLFRKLEKKVIQLEAEISNRKQIEKKLKESEEHYQTMADYAFDWEYWLAPDGAVLYMSPSCERITGYRVADFIAVPDLIETIIFPDDLELFERHNLAVRNNTANLDFHEAVFRIMRRDGELRWISHNCKNIIREDGITLGRRSTNRDITVRKQAEEALQRSTRKYSSLYNSMMDSFVMVDLDGKLLEFNYAYKEMLGYSEAELYAFTYKDITPAKWHEFEDQIVKEQVLKRGYSNVYEKEYIRKDGTVFPIELRAYLNRDDKGSPATMWAIIRDISERKQSETALRESERKHRIVADNTYDWEFWIDPQANFIYSSPSCLRVTGHDSSEFINDSSLMQKIIHPDDRELYAEHVIEALHSGNPGDITFRIIRPDGTERWIGHVCQTILDENGNILGRRGSNRDITDRMRIEAEIKFRNTILSTQQEASFDGILVVDENENIISNNHRFIEICNIPSEIIESRSHERAVNFILGQLVNPEQFLEKLRYLNHHRDEKSHDEIALNDGRTFDRYSAPMIGSDGTHYGRVWHFRDITERKKAEKELLLYRDHLEDIVRERTVELIESEKNLKQAKAAAEGANKAKTVFLSSMSHEIRTPLNAVLGFSQLMLRDDSLTGQQREWIVTINRSGEHLLALINDILEISRIESGRVKLSPDLFDLGGFLDDLKNMFFSQVEDKNIALEMALDEKLPQFIEVDGNKLRQIFINLLGNAVKFTDSGKITVRVYAKRNVIMKSRLIADVDDTGPGISSEDIKKIFNTFEQSSAGVKKGGTGLGLSISRQFARLMGGDITAKSGQGKGSSFHFEVEYKEREKPASHDTTNGKHVTGIEKGQKVYRILIVDDEPANRALLTAILTNAGFVIEEAANGMDVLERYKINPPDLIFLDMGMPGMGGYEVVKKIKSLGKTAHVPIIAVTAAAFTENKNEILQTGVDGYIRKPYKIYEIFDALQSFLGIRFTYGKEISEHAAEGGKIPPEALAVLPEDLVSEILEAARRLDLDRLLELINETEKISPQAVPSLRSLAKSYRYDDIIKILQERKP
jgi:PAS domain S-box-containing protein